jgi:hypothetical protein
MRHSARFFLSLAVTSLVLAACSGTTAPDRELRAARALWNQRGPTSYDITVARYCECLSSGPVLVSVRDGLVVSRTYLSNSTDVGLEYAEGYPTIEGLFGRIDDARRQHAASVDVQYDPSFGFPSMISIDYSRPAVDDEVTYRAYDFHQR